METKQKILAGAAEEYCRASKKEKTKIIDRVIATSDYNRKYAIHRLKSKAVVYTTVFNNVKKTCVKLIKEPRNPPRAEIFQY